MKIMLVDDSRTIRNLQKNVLKQIGYNDIVDAEDGAVAFQIFKDQPPDLMLVDWNTPSMDGVTLIRKVREVNKTIPIIMCTTEAERSRVLEAIQAGVSNYIVKPFTAESLREKISQTIAHSAAAEAAAAATGA